MRKHTYKLIAITFFSVLVFASFTNIKQGRNVINQDHYSIKELPAEWKSNNSLVDAIDYILPNTVPELKHSISCTDCEAPYTISLLIDSPIVINRKIEDLSGKKRAGGANYQSVTTFAFKSSLAVYDYNKKGIAMVVVTDPTEHEFTIKKKFNLYSKEGEKKLTVEQYADANPSEVGPTQQDLVNFAEKRMYRLRDELRKLLRRN